MVARLWLAIRRAGLRQPDGQHSWLVRFGDDRSYRLAVGGRVGFSLLLVGGLGFDEGGDPVVQFVDPFEAAVAAGDDGHLRARTARPARATSSPPS